MEIAYTEEQQALKSELRAYYENLLTPELEQELSQAHGIGPVVRRVVQQMGQDGRHPCHVVPGLAGWLPAPEDHVLHLFGVELGHLLEHRLDHERAQVVGPALDE